MGLPAKLMMISLGVPGLEGPPVQGRQRHTKGKPDGSDGKVAISSNQISLAREFRGCSATGGIVGGSQDGSARAETPSDDQSRQDILGGSRRLPPPALVRRTRFVVVLAVLGPLGQPAVSRGTRTGASAGDLRAAASAATNSRWPCRGAGARQFSPGA